MICVLLHEQGVEPSVRLCQALGNKGIQVRTCTNAYEAMGMLCRAERGENVTLSILLLDEPERLGDVVGLVELAGVYAPKSVCWMFTMGPPEQVREVCDADLDNWMHTSVQIESDGVDGPDTEIEVKHEPSLRIVGESERGPELSAPAAIKHKTGDPGRLVGRTDNEEPSERDSTEPDREPILTDEELSMLLADEFDKHDSNDGHG